MRFRCPGAAGFRAILLFGCCCPSCGSAAWVQCPLRWCCCSVSEVQHHPPETSARVRATGQDLVWLVVAAVSRTLRQRPRPAEIYRPETPSSTWRHLPLSGLCFRRMILRMVPARSIRPHALTVLPCADRTRGRGRGRGDHSTRSPIVCLHRRYHGDESPRSDLCGRGSSVWRWSAHTIRLCVLPSLTTASRSGKAGDLPDRSAWFSPRLKGVRARLVGGRSWAGCQGATLGGRASPPRRTISTAPDHGHRARLFRKAGRPRPCRTIPTVLNDPCRTGRSQACRTVSTRPDDLRNADGLGHVGLSLQCRTILI
ncbi:hypothetical protein BC793_104283 [Actinoplanes xinjiangensis]|uniref:Secreted protein n=1 Tax=Actinoplanes xinjiangensis TaxID=512350 RepID=A0A316FL32_9ACTN|nr:hypothetical protein BC793_104283 [Actinoplanes xinjiangensis]